MNDKQLHLFITVADHGSFSRAEDAVYITKQAVIRQINALEEEIGTPLLSRTSGGVTLTQAGRIFYSGAKEMLALQEKVVAGARSASIPDPVIRIGQVEHQALLHPVTDAFVVKYPDIRIRKVIHPNHSGEYRVANGIIDVGETFYAENMAQHDFAYTRLADMPYLAAMRPGHPLSGQKSVTLAQLSAYPLTVFRPMVKHKYLDTLTTAAPSNLIIRSDVDHQVQAVFDCSVSDGILLTANCFVRHIPEIVCVPLAEGWTQEYGIIYRPNPTPTIQKYIDLAVWVYANKQK